VSEPKPFSISKRLVVDAFKSVKANKGAPGADDETIAEFEADLKGNLYKLWNRMSSGSYFPQPVRAVEIPKKDGKGSRILGVPTVTDRIAQTVVKMVLEPELERVFHDDSYGYRPGRSALDAVGVCRRRCWKADWVIDLDVKVFFDTVDHDLILKAVGRHTDQQWVLLYVGRWLQAPTRHVDGTVEQRERGTPQGSAISPLLANLFMHYAFDVWMGRKFPTVAFAAVLRRRGRSLHHREASPFRERLYYPTAGGCRSGGSSRQDTHRVLQGHEPQRLRGARAVRFPRLHVPAAPGGQQDWRALRQLRAGCEWRRQEGDREDDPSVAYQPAQ
jgi:retron-type reverse transcriptase